jgi:Tfp pilus assembly PilM family ATPase
MARAEVLKKENGFKIVPDTYQLETIQSVYAHIFEETKRVVTQYETAHKTPISAILLTGGGGVTKELITYARQFFSIDVRVSDPFAKVQAPEFMRPLLKEIGPEFAVAVGLALRKLEELP